MSTANRPPVCPGQIWRDRQVKGRYLRCLDVFEGTTYRNRHGYAIFESVQRVHGAWVASASPGCRKRTTIMLNAGGAPRQSTLVLHENATEDLTVTAEDLAVEIVAGMMRERVRLLGQGTMTDADVSRCAEIEHRLARIPIGKTAADQEAWDVVRQYANRIRRKATQESE